MTLPYAEAAYLLNEKLSPTEMSVLAMIALMANPGGECWPSQQTIADRTRLHKDTVRAALQTLSEKKLIGKAKRLREDGSTTSNMMVMLFEPARLGPGKTGAAPRASGSSAPPGSTTRRRPAVHPGLEESSEESSTPLKAPRGAVPVEVVEEAKALRAETPEKARVRSSVNEIARALNRAIGDGATAAEVRRALRCYYADEDCAREGHLYAKGPHRMIQGDLWRDWIPEDDEDAPGEPEKVYAPEVVAAHLDRVWTSRMEDFAVGKWDRFTWGPKPGETGCAVPPHILEKAGGAS